MKNITKISERFISNHPSIKDCLKKGLINYSSLARLISKQENIKNFEAIVMAIRRYKDKITKDSSHEKDIKKILKDSKVEIKNRIIIVVIDKPRNFESLHILEKEIKKKKSIFNLIEGRDTITIVTEEEYLDVIKNELSSLIIKINTNMAMVNLICPPEIETTPGVITYVYSLFSEIGVNIYEEMSCWTDILIIIDEKEIGRVMELLRF